MNINIFKYQFLSRILQYYYFFIKFKIITKILVQIHMTKDKEVKRKKMSKTPTVKHLIKALEKRDFIMRRN